MLNFSKVYNYLTDFRVNFKKSVQTVFSSKAFKIYLIITLVLQGLSWYLSFYIYRSLTGNLLILHYNVDYGTDLIGPPHLIFGGVLFGLLVFIVNSFLALWFSGQKKSNFFDHLLIAGAMIINLFLLLSLFTIYLNNFR